MKRSKLSLACLMLLVAANQASAQDEQFASPGDLSTYGEPAGGDVELVGDLELDGTVGDLDTFVGDLDAPPVPEPMPATLSHAHPMPMAHSLSSMCDDGDGCGSGIGSIGKRACGNDLWLNAETLLWFPQDLNSPPLVTTGPLAAQTLAFGDPIESDMGVGFRFDYGRRFGDGTFGIGARFWGLLGQESDYTVGTADPNVNIQRPYFELSVPPGPGNGQFIVSGLGQFTGNMTVRSELDLLATEVYGRMLLTEGNGYRVDLLAGYTSFNIEDDLLLRQQTNGGPVGRERVFQDSYNSENVFHGGQLGLETSIRKGRWSVTSLTKVHMGNMNQRVRMRGFSSDRIIPGAPATFDNGFYIQGQQGVYERDEFAFAPELGMKLGFSPRSNIHFTVGYTFAFWSSLALSGNQIDTKLDSTLLLTNIAKPGADQYQIVDDTFWIQGIDLGIAIDF